jgi:hypothetical protein
MRSLTAVLCGIGVAACASPIADGSPAGPADPSAEMRPDLIIAEPARVAPGVVVALTFPEETERGILFVLEQRVADTWVHRYNLASDGPGPQFQMSWHRLDEPDIAFPDIGVGGPGPDHVPIPETAEPGAWRICTGNAGDEFCTPIEISP